MQVFLNPASPFEFCKSFWILQIFLNFANSLNFKNSLNSRIKNFILFFSFFFFFFISISRVIIERLVKIRFTAKIINSVNYFNVLNASSAALQQRQCRNRHTIVLNCRNRHTIVAKTSNFCKNRHIIFEIRNAKKIIIRILCCLDIWAIWRNLQ